MKTRTTPNITSTAQFPPLNQHIKNDLSNDMSDESSSDDDSLPELFNRGNTSDSESEDENTLDDTETIIKSHKEYKNIPNRTIKTPKHNISRHSQQRHQSRKTLVKDTNNKKSKKIKQTRQEEIKQMTIIDH